MAKAAREEIGVHSDLIDLAAKPRRTAAELEQAENPPEKAEAYS